MIAYNRRMAQPCTTSAPKERIVVYLDPEAAQWLREHPWNRRSLLVQRLLKRHRDTALASRSRKAETTAADSTAMKSGERR